MVIFLKNKQFFKKKPWFAVVNGKKMDITPFNVVQCYYSQKVLWDRDVYSMAISDVSD